MPSPSFADVMANPQMLDLGLALMSAGSPSTTPTNLATAFAKAAPVYQQLGMGRANLGLAQLMLGLKAAQMKWMQGPQPDPNNPDAPPLQPPQTAASAPAGPQDQPGAASANPFMDPNSDMRAMLDGPQGGNAAPAAPTGLAASMGGGASAPQGGDSGNMDPTMDPIYQYYAQGARVGIPEAAQLAQQRLTAITGSPGYQGAVQKAKSGNTLYDLRSGGVLFDAKGNILAQAPKMGEGMRLNQGGYAEALPGYAPLAAGLQNINEQVKNANTQSSYVDTTGAEHPTSVAANLAGTYNPFDPLSHELFSGALLPGSANGTTAAAATPAAGGSTRTTKLSPQAQEQAGTLGKAYGDEWTKDNDAAQAATSSLYNLSTMGEELKGFTPGAWNEYKEPMVKFFNAIDPSHQAGEKYLGSIQAFDKGAVRNSIQYTKQNFGSRIAKMEVELAATKANANSDMAGDALNTVINQSRADSIFTASKPIAFQQWKSQQEQAGQSPDYGSFNTKWNQNVSRDLYAYLAASPADQIQIAKKLGPDGMRQLAGSIISAKRMGWLPEQLMPQYGAIFTGKQ